MLTNDGEIELGDIYGGGGSEFFEAVNLVQKIAKKAEKAKKVVKKKGGLHINSPHPARKEPERLTEEDITRLGPLPMPTTFMSSLAGEEEDDDDRL